MREIIITVSDDGQLDVREGDRYCDGLAWDEMLGQVAAMTAPVERISKMNGLFTMLNKEEWEAKRNALIESIEQSDVDSIFKDAP